MDSLQYLVLDIDYWSPFSSLESSLEWWRAKYYSIYYGCNYHNGELKYNYELAVHNSKTFHTAFEGLENELNIADVSNINVTELGFGVKYSSKLRVENWDHGKINAIQHTEWIESQAHLKLIEKNRAFVQDIVNKCVERHIKVLLISTPTYETYNTNRDKKYLKIKDDFCKSFVSPTKNVIFSDFSEDNRFGKADFFDAYHLNEIGAKKLTLILNNKISNLN